MSKKQEQADQLNLMSRIKPSADITFASKNEDGSVTELNESDEFVKKATSRFVSEEVSAFRAALGKLEKADTEIGNDAPFTHAPNSDPNTPEIPTEFAQLVRIVDRLVSRVEALADPNIVVNVPAPVINITMPDITRTVTRVVERDENGFVTKITETTEDTPDGDPAIDIEDTK